MRKSLAMLKLVVACVLTMLLPAGLDAAPLDRYWPQARHDAQRSSHVPAAGNLTQPAVRWRFFLGGGVGLAMSLDVDLDGQDEILAIEGGHLTARSPLGKLHWSTPALGATGVRGIVDLTGDGIPEVIATGQNDAHVISAVTGAVLWSSPAKLLPLLTFVAAADFDGDGVADLALAPNGGAGLTVYPTTHIFRFVGAIKEFATTPVPSPGIDAVVSAGTAAIDVDGDGVADILQCGTKHIYAFHGKTGALMAQSEALNDLAFGGATIASVPTPGGAPLLVYAADDKNGAYQLRGTYVMRREGTTLKLLWSYALADVAADRFRVAPASIGDLDGDGVAEMVFGRFSAGHWQIEARDLLTGNVLHTADENASWLGAVAGQGGPALASTFRLGAAGPLTLRCTLATTADVPPYGAQRLLTWSRTAGFQQLADLGNGLLSGANLQPVAGNPALAATAVPLSTPMTGATELLVSRDLDGDLRADRLDLLRVAFTGQVTTQAQKTMASPLQPLSVVRDGKGGRKVLTSAQDGRCAMLDAALALTNDADGDGVADLRYGGASNPHMTVAPVKDTDTTPLLLTATGDQLVVLDPALAGPVTPPTVKWSFRSGSWPPRANMADLDGDGTREVLVRHRPTVKGATLSAFTAMGIPIWDYLNPQGPWQWATNDGDNFAVADVDGDGADDAVAVFALSGASQPGDRYSGVVSGKTGKALWPADAACGGMDGSSFAVDTSVKPARIDWSVYYFRFLCEATTGQMLNKASGKSMAYGVPMLRDLDDDGLPDHVLAGAGGGMAAETVATAAQLWVAGDADIYHAAATLLQSGKDVLVASCSNVEPSVTTRDARTGKTLWRRIYLDGKAWVPADAPKSALPSMGLVSVADLTGLGHPSLLFRTAQGWLYAVNALDGSVDWALDWGGAFGDPIPADIDGDGLVEVLVAFSDGYLYALDHSSLSQVAWVRDNAGSGPALAEAQDIDQQEDTTALHANWATVAGAQGYVLEILDGGGAVVSPFTDVKLATEATASGLSLQPGMNYRASVRGYVTVGKDQAFSVATLSDGVTIVDVSAPWIDGQLATPAALGPGGSSMFVAHLHDKTRLASWRLDIAAAGGTTPTFTAQGPLAKPEWDLIQPWSALDAAGKPLPAGDYVATVTATDTAGHTATASMTVHVCLGTPASVDACTVTLPPGPDAKGGGKVPSVPGSHPSDCQAARAGPLSPWLALVLLAATLLVARRRQGN